MRHSVADCCAMYQGLGVAFDVSAFGGLAVMAFLLCRFPEALARSVSRVPAIAVVAPATVAADATGAEEAEIAGQPHLHGSPVCLVRPIVTAEISNVNTH